MLLSLLVAGATCLSLTLTVYFLPQKRIGRTPFSVYSLVPVVGAIVAVATGAVTAQGAWKYFISDSPSNPIKIVVLFISMSLISVYLDETGFFGYVASVAAAKTGGKQIKIFVAFYVTVSVLTVFTSNDIVVLTFTPFICQFCKHAKINAVPYVFSEFVAANTWSLFLLIGNPTNVFLTQSSGISFFGYMKIMWLPTVLAGVTSFFVLLAVFGKSLKKEACAATEEVRLKEKTFTIIGLVYLALCTLCIAILPYFGVEMYFVAAAFCAALLVTVLVLRSIKKQKPTVVIKTLKRAPFEMIPLVLGMSVIALSLFDSGATKALADALGSDFAIIKYGALSTLSSNVLNNIPMSIVFSDVVKSVPTVSAQKAVYSTIIGSNIGAFLTPLGALAGLMFSSVLSRHGVKFSFLDFVKYGAIVAVPALAAALAGLYVVL